jgi:glycosyltransferase involved in cell wall biosynthesis
MHRKVCAAIRHPTYREGQTAFAREFLKVLRMIYGDELIAIDTANCAVPSKNMFLLCEAAKILSTRCDVVILLNVNKLLITALNLRRHRVLSFQFSYLPEIHSNWKVKRALIERGSTLVVGTSRRIARLFDNGVFTYPPVDTDLFKPRDKLYVRRLLGLPVDKFIVGYVGDLDVNRGFDVVARLAAELGGDRVKFLITSLRIENLPKEVLFHLKKALSKNAIVVKGLTPIWYIYNAVDVLLLPIPGPYPTEPPATLLEALASGTPVIGGPSPTMDDYTGLYIRVKDNDYLSLVKQTIDMRTELDELSIKAREFATKNLAHRPVAHRLSKTLI